MSDSSSDIGAFLAGFVMGGLVGAATALILAPQSGAETRAQIAAKGEEFRLASEQQIQEYRETASSAVSDAKERVNESSKQIQEQARIVLDEGKAKVNEALGTAAGEGARTEESSEESDYSGNGQETEA